MNVCMTFLFLIELPGNTASPALKLAVIKKAHGLVIADSNTTFGK